MCGIAGIISSTDQEQRLAEQVHRMTTCLHHRGPDDEGFLLLNASGAHVYYGDDTPHAGEATAYDASQEHIRQAYQTPSVLAFGHRRLSIIDLSFSGHQPMSYRGRYWIVFNGEIYNFIELREDLIREGYSFSSTSDTEVIMAAYDHWGAACVQRFNGMWAFVIYDTQERTLFLSRDRFGIKPLYYYKDETHFIFASEIKAILQCDQVDTEPNLAYCNAYLATGSREYGRETAFTNIFRFDIASALELNLDDLAQSNLKPQRFWTIHPTTRIEAFDEAQARRYAEQYYTLLDDAVRLRLRADVRVGSALSGGLDSSAIVYLVYQQLKQANRTEKQETFSTVWKSEGVQDCDESAYVDELADTFHLNSHQIEPRAEDVLAEHRKMVYAMDDPPPMPHMGGWYTFKCATDNNIKVTLDGQGADELMGGYLVYLANYLLDLPLLQLRKGYRVFTALPGVQRKHVWTGVVSNLVRRIVGWRGMQSLMTPLLKRAGAKNPIMHLMPLNLALHESAQTVLVNLLHYGDSQSMAHSVESRLPYLDYRLVEFLAEVPAVYKLHAGWTKHIARLSMAGKLPDTITWRKDKMGWPDPIDFWFRGALKEPLCRAVESSVFLRQLGVGYDIRERMEGGEPMRILIRLFNLSVWHDTFFGITQPPREPDAIETATTMHV